MTTPTEKRDYIASITRPEDVRHLMDVFRLLGITYDLETLDLTRAYNMPTQIGASVRDILGRALARVDIRPSVPEYRPLSAAAAVITNTFPNEIHYKAERDPPHIATGRIARLFGKPYRHLWDSLPHGETIAIEKNAGDETVREINATELNSDAYDGAVEDEKFARYIDYLDEMMASGGPFRLHDKGRSIAYQLPLGADGLPENMQDWDGVYRDFTGRDLNRATSTFWRKIPARAVPALRNIKAQALWEGDADGKPRRQREIFRSNIKTDDVRLWHFPLPDGSRETFRLREGGKYLSRPLLATQKHLPHYTEVTGEKWREVRSPASTTGFNVGFDSQQLKQMGFEALLQEIIFDRLKKNFLYQIDTRGLYKAAVAFNDKGADGVQPGTKKHPVTGQEYYSFGLSAAMEANGPHAHGYERCIRMPDGSIYDRTLGHISANYDIAATESLRAFIRWHDPELARHMELLTDLEEYTRFLSGMEHGFGNYPLVSFIRDNFPNVPDVKLGIAIGSEQQIKEVRQAILLRTDTGVPLEEFKFGGKRLFDMSPRELADMIEAQNGKPDALIQILNMRKNHTVFPAEMAFKRGKAHDPEWHEAQRRQLVQNRLASPPGESLAARLIAACQMLTPEFLGAADTDDTRAEEETHLRFSEPKELYFPQPDGSWGPAPRAIHDLAIAVWRRQHNIGRAMRGVLQPSPLEWIDRIPPEQRMEELDEFLEAVAKTKADLEKYQAIDAENPIQLLEPDVELKPESEKDEGGETYPPTPEAILKSCRDAMDYIWKLRAAHRASFDEVTDSFRIYRKIPVAKQGQAMRGEDGKRLLTWQEVPADWLAREREEAVAAKLTSGEYKIEFERLGFAAELVVNMFMTTPGRLDWIKERLRQKLAALATAKENALAKSELDELPRLEKERVFIEQDLQEWAEWENYFAARAALHMHGPPNTDPSDHEWSSGPKILQEIRQIRANLRVLRKKGAKGLDIPATEEESGLWEILMQNHEQAEEILTAVEDHVKAMMKKYPLTPEHIALMGYHPERNPYGDKGMPIEAAKYPLAIAAPVLLLDVPDALLQGPLEHVRQGPHLIPVLLPDDTLDLHAALHEHGTQLIFRGKESGKTFYATNPHIVEEIKPDAAYTQLYTETVNAYEEAGLDLPDADKKRILWLQVETAPAQVPVALRRVKNHLQTIKVRAPELFDGTVSTLLSHRSVPISGLMYRLDSTEPSTGPARLQEMLELPSRAGSATTKTIAANSNQVESGWEREVNVESVRIYTLAEFKELIARSMRVQKFMQQHKIAELSTLKAKVANEAGGARSKEVAKIADDVDAGVMTNQDTLRYGYHGLDSMRTAARALFNKQDRDEEDPTAKIVLVDFSGAEKSLLAYNNPARRLQAREGIPLNPLVAFDVFPSADKVKKMLKQPGRPMVLSH